VTPKVKGRPGDKAHEEISLHHLINSGVEEGSLFFIPNDWISDEVEEADDEKAVVEAKKEVIL
jgi:hypothetical protein